MIAYLTVTTWTWPEGAFGYTPKRERLPFRKTRDTNPFPCSGPDLFPEGKPHWHPVHSGYGASYCGVSYHDLADWCRKWGLEVVVHEQLGGAL